MKTIEFTNKETTKEQYLKFKEYIKDTEKIKVHSDYVAYYIFKHRIIGEERDKYLDDEVNNRCHKGLLSGRIGGCGGDCINWGIANFKSQVKEMYNEFAEADGEK